MTEHTAECERCDNLYLTKDWRSPWLCWRCRQASAWADNAPVGRTVVTS